VSGAFSEDVYRLGVGVMLMNASGLIFVGRRIDTDGQAWQMPQGGIDSDEDPRKAALRELKEETGTADAAILAETPDWLSYDLPEDLRRRVWSGRYKGQRQKWFLMRFLGSDADIDLEADDHPEFSAWRWAPAAEVPDLIVPFKRDLYRAVLGIFQDRIGPAE
jgi:putative (di)nucleoside polyphosphate hydrolase